MRQNELKKILSKYFKKAQKLFDDVKNGATKENIHDLRVVLKKMAALIDLINMQQARKIVLTISPLVKEFYDLLGELRQLQLQQELVNSVCREMELASPQHYLNDLKNEEQATEEQLADKPIDVNVMKKIIMRHLPPAIKKKTCLEYTVAKKAHLRQLCKLPADDKRMHEIRKILKNILYNIDYLQTGKGDPLILKENSIHTLADDIGDYHDLSVAQYNTWYYRSNNPGKKDENLTDIESYLGKQKLSQRNALMQKIRGFVNQDR